MRIGWIGLGKMGLPMARRLVEAGHHVRVFTRNPDGRRRAEEASFPTFDNLAEAADHSDLVISAIPDDAALEEIVEGGLASAMTACQIFIDTSTVSPAASGRVAQRLAERGI